jgi:hypothetical protein
MARKTTTPAKPEPTAHDITHTLASAKPATCGEAHTVLVTSYGEAVADRIAASGCRRLPRHEMTVLKGHKADKPRGLMTPAERRRMADRVTKPKAAVIASKVVTVGGTKFRVFANGKVTPVEAPSADAATPVTRRPGGRPKVRRVPIAESPRRVAAPRTVTKRGRGAHQSGQPSARLA